MVVEPADKKFNSESSNITQDNCHIMIGYKLIYNTKWQKKNVKTIKSK